MKPGKREKTLTMDAQGFILWAESKLGMIGIRMTQEQAAAWWVKFRQ